MNEGGIRNPTIAQQGGGRRRRWRSGQLIQHFTRHRLPLHARIVVFSITPVNFVASKLINFSQALHVFDEITVRNAFSYNALLIAYTSREMYSDALSLSSSWIGSSRYSSGPDSISISWVLKALSGYDGLIFRCLCGQWDDHVLYKV